MSLDTVKIKNGMLRAAKTGDGEVREFRGVPYAAAPVGALRWRPPEPHPGWEGVRSADRFSPAGMQEPYAKGSFYHREYFKVPVEYSEDSLYLNVWTPAVSPGEGLPVYVWFHGGGLYQGWGHSVPFDGANLARLGIVVVTVNYRLNVFGLLAHPELSAESERGVSGNYTLLDQLEAIRWVNENCVAFGGDPGKITIGGQSGGGRSVGVHLVSPLAKGLFSRAISESGCAVGAGVSASLAEGEQTGLELMRKMGASSLRELRAMPAPLLLERFLKAMPGWPGLTPVVDGYVYGDDPARSLQSGKQNGAALLSGSTTGEGALYRDGITVEGYQKGAGRFGSLAGEYLRQYPGDTLEEALRSANLYSSDRYYACHRAASLLHERTSGQRAYQYLFDKAPPGFDSAFYGAFHTGELAYVFGNLEQIDRPWTEEDRRLSAVMSRFWTNFIRTGDPNGEGLPRWKPFGEANGDVMLFGDKTGMAPAPDPERREFVERYLSEWLADTSGKKLPL